ncbi:aspartate aminotransferase family protein [Pseudoalteromonas sp. OOF1S-7]|uniref:aspartate aminotransferase family protein n=1 Tax=Pseudoalteromonas sp. OOF1S-7 TaxID=2917757 RepID=UPI001EF5C4F6|nr:aspartate aminotransferase family protein [Pseudoalteromonas sp. OOF1S-7]MCG7537519.1 aspartate aminotransferase family protein [Pseudoalteromonas sp. OOF1S-7]
MDNTLAPAAKSSADFEQILQLCKQHLSKGRAKISDVFGTDLEVSSKGAWITTSNGTQYLNAGGYGVFIHGARHPHVEQAVIQQIQTNPVSSRILLEPTAALAAEALIRIAPKGLRHVHFAGSGAEATEAAIKLCRTLGRTRLITTKNGYHGKTMGALSVTANDVYQSPFQPLLGDIDCVEFGDLNAMEDALKQGSKAAVIIEPIQGEGGVRIPPCGYLKAVKALCVKYDALLILDEIQTGMGRLGRWWGADFEQVTPDIMLCGKGLSGGIVPVSAMVATPDVFKAFNRDPFIHTSTFSGAPIAMAAVKAAIEAIENDDLTTKATALGKQIKEGLEHTVRHNCAHLVKEVRGIGLLIGVELHSPGLAGALIAELIERRLIVNYSLNAGAVLRFTPSAVMSQSDVVFLLEAFESACIALAEQYPSLNSVGVI